MDQNCESYAGNLLTLETDAETFFTSGGSFDVTTTIGVHPENLEATGNENVLVTTNNEPIVNQGQIIFCIKSHSTVQATLADDSVSVIEMEVETIKYTVEYNGSDETFSLNNGIVAQDIGTGVTFQDGQLLETGVLVVHRCTATSTDDSGDASAAVEEEDFYLCVGPEQEDMELSDINLNALYGTSNEQTLPLVTESGNDLSVVSVEIKADGTKFTRLTVPILSVFIESGGATLTLSGDADIGFEQDSERLDEESDGRDKAFFEFVVELEGMKEVGCFGKLYGRMKSIFF